jgi:hypothetical protein
MAFPPRQDYISPGGIRHKKRAAPAALASGPGRPSDPRAGIPPDGYFAAKAFFLFASVALQVLQILTFWPSISCS